MVKTLTILFLLIFFLPLPYLLSKPEARARSQVVFLINDAAVSKIIELRQQSRLPDLFQRLLYNRPTYFVRQFAGNYLGYFSPQFLFTQGGTQYQFSVPNRGLLYFINLPFFYLGLYLVFKKAFKKDPNFLFFILWLAVSPIPAAITNEANAVVRATTMLPVPMIVTALGLTGFFVWLQQKSKQTSTIALYVIYLGVLFLFARSYLGAYFTEYRKDYSWSWQWGYKEAVGYARENYGKYDKIIVTKKYGEPHEFFLFFWPWDPGQYRGDPNLIRFYQSDWYWVDGFDKFYFVNDWDIPKEKDAFILESKKVIDCMGKKCLLITSPGNYPMGWKKLETINFLDGKPAFELYEN